MCAAEELQKALRARAYLWLHRFEGEKDFKSIYGLVLIHDDEYPLCVRPWWKTHSGYIMFEGDDPIRVAFSIVLMCAKHT